MSWLVKKQAGTQYFYKKYLDDLWRSEGYLKYPNNLDLKTNWYRYFLLIIVLIIYDKYKICAKYNIEYSINYAVDWDIYLIELGGFVLFIDVNNKSSY